MTSSPTPKPTPLSLAAQLPFRFRLPGHVGGGAEQTEAVEGRSWVYGLLHSPPAGIVQSLSGGQWELRRTRVHKFAAFICIEVDTENVCVCISTNANLNTKKIYFSLDRILSIT